MDLGGDEIMNSTQKENRPLVFVEATLLASGLAISDGMIDYRAWYDEVIGSSGDTEQLVEYWMGTNGVGLDKPGHGVDSSLEARSGVPKRRIGGGTR